MAREKIASKGRCNLGGGVFDKAAMTNHLKSRRKPAAQICMEGSYSAEGWLCDGCAAEGDFQEEMLLPVVNSPRTGVCGHTG